MTDRPAPDKRSPLPPGSLRARLILGLAAMLLPPLLLSAGAFFSLQVTTSAAQKVLEKAIREFHPVAHSGLPPRTGRSTPPRTPDATG